MPCLRTENGKEKKKDVTVVLPTVFSHPPQGVVPPPAVMMKKSKTEVKTKIFTTKWMPPKKTFSFMSLVTKRRRKVQRLTVSSDDTCSPQFKDF